MRQELSDATPDSRVPQKQEEVPSPAPDFTDYALPEFTPDQQTLAPLQLTQTLDQHISLIAPDRLQRETLAQTESQTHPRVIIRELFTLNGNTATAASTPEVLLPGQLSLTPKTSSAPPLALSTFCATHNWKLEKPYAFSPQHRITLPAKTIAAHNQAVNELNELFGDDLDLGEAYLLIQPTATPDDPKYTDGTLWHLNKIDAAAAWNLAQGNSQTLIGVVDIGIDVTHEDLASNIGTNPNEIPANSIDDDDNGLVDDISGWNFNNNSNDIANSTFSHGTEVAGIIAAVGNNATGITGVSWKAGLVSINIAGADSNEISSAIDYMTHLKNTYRLPVLATNNSYVLNVLSGNPPPSQPELAIERARDAGILFVAGAGNDARDTDTDPRYPAGYSTANIISVTATNSSDTLWWTSSTNGSNWGATSVDLAAPGDTIYSTQLNDTYGTNSGTSMATPMVVSTLALMKDANPALNADTLKSIVMSTVTPLSALTGNSVSEGRLNTYAAVETAMLYPRIELRHPGTPALIPTGGTYSLVAHAWDYDGNITEVRFLLNGSLTHTDTDGSDGYTCQWAPPSDDTYTLILEAEDNTGNTTRTEPMLLHAGSLIIDDTDAANLSFNTWGNAPAADSYNGTQQQAAPTADNRFNFYPEIPYSADYELAMHWSTGTWGNNATLVVHHGGTQTSTTADQSTNQGTWNTIGTYAFTQGQDAQRIILQSLGASANVVADAIRLTPSAFGSGDDIVSLYADTPLASESDLQAASITFTRTNSTNPLTVNYTISGTATTGTDYTTLSGQVTIPDGSYSTTLPITPLNDGDSAESPETVTLTLQTGTGYLPGAPESATITIHEGATSFASWQNAISWSGSDSSATADPDQDGLDNFVEYALGSSPLDPASGNWLTITPSSTNAVEFSFNRASAGVDYVVQYSTDLANWFTYAINPGNAGGNVSLTIPQTNGKIFLRLRLTE